MSISLPFSRFFLLIALTVLSACATTNIPAGNCPADRQALENCPPLSAVDDPELNDWYRHRAALPSRLSEEDPIALGIEAQIPVQDARAKFLGSSEEEARGSGGTYSASAQARYNLALCQHRLGHIEAALEAYRRALEDAPQSADAHAGVGVALWQLGQPVEAAAELRRALVLKPAHEQARVNLDRLLTSGDAV